MTQFKNIAFAVIVVGIAITSNILITNSREPDELSQLKHRVEQITMDKGK